MNKMQQQVKEFHNAFGVPAPPKPQLLEPDRIKLRHKAYYEDESVVLYHGDCREYLPDIWADILITDPPYGMNFQSNYRKEKHDVIIGDTALPLDLIKMAIARARCASYVFCRWDVFRYMPHPKSLLVWVKNNWGMGDLEHEHGRQWEACCFYEGHQHRFKKRIPDVIRADRTGNVLHPTEKPVDLLQTIIAANEGQIILDPFAGSGATLLAAVLEGRKAIGVEVEEKYCAIIAERFTKFSKDGKFVLT